jgi:hypothetical protein
MMQIKPGDIVVSKLPLDYGFAFGRVLPPDGTSSRWRFLGHAADREKACDAACRDQQAGQTVWVFDSYDRYIPCGSAGCDATQLRAIETVSSATESSQG